MSWVCLWHEWCVSMCGCTFERAVHMMSDAVSDSSMHIEATSGFVSTHQSAECPESCLILKSRISQKSRLFRKSRDFCENLDFQDFPGFPDFGTLAARSDFWRPDPISGSEGRIGPTTRFPDFRTDRQVLSRPADLSESPEIWSQGPKSGTPCVLIDHFQYQVRWKMTGEDGDPFGGPRWHWPSKRSNFEKKSLITKIVKIAEKGTFFSFTLEKPRKMALFLPPKVQNYRHLRSSIPTVFWPFFSIFWGVENSENFALFFDFRKSQKIVSEHKILEIALFRKSRDFRDFGCQTRFLRFA